jgi:hypothetical protein
VSTTASAARSTPSGRTARLRAPEQLVELMKSLDVWITTAGEAGGRGRSIGPDPRSFPQPVVDPRDGT